MSKHPDDRIFATKDFINELSKVQDRYFKKLVKKLGIDSQLEDHLFDYIYNEDKMVTFGEYLDQLGVGDLWDGI